MASTEAAAARPDDTDILEHERKVKDEALRSPLVGPRESVESLKAQYADNPGFLPKVDSLGKRFTAIRRTRPDGNCFYRAYIFGIFEQLAGNQERSTPFAGVVRKSLDYCCEVGYERVAIEDFFDEFTSCVDKVCSEGAQIDTVEKALEECDGYLVCWARCLTSAFLKHNAELYQNFLSSHGSILEFCAQEVDPMNTEADHLQINALSSFFGVPVNVIYLDQSEGDTAAEHLFQEGSSAPTVHLLYRPGHYDIIYPH